MLLQIWESSGRLLCSYHNLLSTLHFDGASVVYIGTSMYKQTIGQKLKQENRVTLPLTLYFSISVSLQDYATMQFCANKLDKKDFFGKSDPFMVFYRSNEDGTWVFLLVFQKNSLLNQDIWTRIIAVHHKHRTLLIVLVAVLANHSSPNKAKQQTYVTALKFIQKAKWKIYRWALLTCVL